MATTTRSERNGPRIVAASPRDSVDGVPARLVARPGTADDLAAVMREAAERELTVVARGAGTKLDWGRPPSDVGLLLDLSGMDRVLEHAAGDLIVRAEPGVRLSDLQALLAVSGQRLAIDEVLPGSTIGGIVATGLCGPLRLAYGCVRDLLIGVSVVRADGALARSGGKVVKNVAGYDLGKLYTGSFGTLGMIAEATFRLHPMPDKRAWVVVALPDEDEVHRCVCAVNGSQLAVSSLEVDHVAPGAPVELAVLVEGIAVSVDRRVDEVVRLLGGNPAVVQEPPPWWARLPGATTVKLTTEVAALPRVLGAVRELGASTGTEPSLRGSAALGVLHVGLARETEPSRAGALVGGLRAVCAESGGSAVVLRAPGAVKDAVDVWGPVRAVELMRRVKDRFDPGHRLSPGRFVGGI